MVKVLSRVFDSICGMDLFHFSEMASIKVELIYYIVNRSSSNSFRITEGDLQLALPIEITQN